MATGPKASIYQNAQSVVYLPLTLAGADSANFLGPQVFKYVLIKKLDFRGW